MNRSPPQPTAGQATVRLRDGRTYVGRAVYDGRSVSIDGRLRTITNGEAVYRARRRLTLPLHRVDSIRWSEPKVIE